MASGYSGITQLVPQQVVEESRSAVWGHLHDRFTRANDASSKMLGELADRLCGVMSPSSQTDEGDSMKEGPEIVPLVEALHQHARAAERNNSILRDIIARLAF